MQDMTINQIIKMCENVKPNDDVLVIFTYIDTDSIQRVHVIRTAKEWLKHDIMISYCEKLSFKIIGGSLIIKVTCKIYR